MFTCLIIFSNNASEYTCIVLCLKRSVLVPVSIRPCLGKAQSALIGFPKKYGALCEGGSKDVGGDTLALYSKERGFISDWLVESYVFL